MTIKISKSNVGTSLSEIKNLERQLGRQLPSDYENFLLSTNGGVPEPNRFEVPQFDTGSGVTWFFGLLGEPKYRDLAYEQKVLGQRLPNGMIAVADAAGGNRICLSIRNRDFGCVYFWDHELESELNVESPLAQLATTFDEFLSILQPFDPESVELEPGQVESAWIDPEFLRSLNEEHEG